ncbi:3-oxoacyl-ACP synthase III family protein [Flavobacteriaceae bacterium]|nr:3-oxoacyl-[acyl-carrier-protein] synthase, KASIII [uncultured bacterium]MDA9002292.1 3-oxoacyl-ACP synthase III family protein [Flavobacteriaceae bacterium]MDA9026542.1 3-oxoacyl-ACP synthase III family protein [Flavobacteriaceae bacterium]MDA9029973.1 3-oxoacyl-ACP synthase III family protein [Flavobacteriaceae bacterium]
MNIKITGTGSYIPKIVQKNEAFQQHSFLNIDGSEIPSSNEIIVEKFQAITGISERRYAENHLTASDLGALAAEKAIKDAGVDPESLDYIILAHNFGDVKSGSIQSDILPCLAARVKNILKIKNPKCVAYDILFGCPGWVEGVIQGQAYIKAGMAKKCLVIGAETLSRVVDPHDRDSMIYSDGAGATVIELLDEDGGILSHETASYTHDEVYHLFFGCSNNKSLEEDTRFIKMYGRKIYEFALSNVPNAMKTCLDNSGFDIKDVKKILIHQANEKMDEAIVNRFYRLYKTPVPEGVMPMSIHKLGNSSVATVPTLLDLIKNNHMEGHEIKKGDIVIFASVGAGMHINAITYKY